MACDGFHVTIFKSLRFSPVHTTNEAFSKVSTFETVLESLPFHWVFGRFSVDDAENRIKKYAFSNEKPLV